MSRKFTLALALVLAIPMTVAGGDWHQGTTLVCSDCHTMHNSRGGAPMRYDGAAAGARKLLRGGTSSAVCLACHDGHRATAPNVTAPTNGDQPAGGFVDSTVDPLQHHLSPDPVVPPLGTTAVVMACTTCHDPHGNAQYRNLRPSPSGTGRAAGTPVIAAQKVIANGTNPGAVYIASNIRHVSGMAQWCLDCHDANPDSAHHPFDRTIKTAPMADWSAWSATFDGRVPAQNPNAADPPDALDQVFCLSCHKAHGSPNPSSLIYADEWSIDSTCVQCHNQ